MHTQPPFGNLYVFNTVRIPHKYQGKKVCLQGLKQAIKYKEIIHEVRQATAVCCDQVSFMGTQKLLQAPNSHHSEFL